MLYIYRVLVRKAKKKTSERALDDILFCPYARTRVDIQGFTEVARCISYLLFSTEIECASLSVLLTVLFGCLITLPSGAKNTIEKKFDFTFYYSFIILYLPSVIICA